MPRNLSGWASKFIEAFFRKELAVWRRRPTSPNHSPQPGAPTLEQLKALSGSLGISPAKGGGRSIVLVDPAQSWVTQPYFPIHQKQNSTLWFLHMFHTFPKSYKSINQWNKPPSVLSSVPFSFPWDLCRFLWLLYRSCQLLWQHIGLDRPCRDRCGGTHCTSGSHQAELEVHLKVASRWQLKWMFKFKISRI